MLPQLTAVLARHPIVVGVAALLATLLLAVPMVLLPPEGFASQEPGGPAFDAREVLDTRLSPDIATEFAIVEARDGEILDPEDLRELHRRLSALRDDPVTGPLLVETFDPELGLPLHGTIAPTDLLERALSDLGGVNQAPDAAMESVLAELLEQVSDPRRLGLAEGTLEVDGRWSSPAVILTLRLDNEALGGGSGGAQVGGDTADRERQLREVRDVLRGGQPGSNVARDDAGSLIAHVVAADDGLIVDDGQAARSPAQVSGIVDRGRHDDATSFTLQLPGSREVTAIAAAQGLLEPRIDALRTDLRSVDPGAGVELTGAPVTRQLTLDAISRALLLSLPIALLACLLVAGVAMRSVRYALIAVVPIVMVVPWLYGTMAVAGFAVNLVTGTIGAISIGIGIDFAIHLIARYREEFARREDRDAAMRATGAGTGLALLASAGSSAIGFSALAFAPMPMFATYGLLTAVMIAMALVATLLVLPPLLRLAPPQAPPVTLDEARGLTPVAAPGSSPAQPARSRTASARAAGRDPRG